VGGATRGNEESNDGEAWAEARASNAAAFLSYDALLRVFREWVSAHRALEHSLVSDHHFRHAAQAALAKLHTRLAAHPMPAIAGSQPPQQGDSDARRRFFQAADARVAKRLRLLRLRHAWWAWRTRLHLLCKAAQIAARCDASDAPTRQQPRPPWRP
jgi:hypothetical protein